MLLETIDSPVDLRKLNRKQLPLLAEEIRKLIIETVSTTGGHLASSLGAVELIIALHYVFDTPNDKIIFDVGHQAYAHKIICGRRKEFYTLRQYGGISGFIRPQESEYDTFISGHSSTAISIALGFVVKRDLKREKYKVIAVIGDGSLSGGLCYEGLNNAGHLKADLLVVLNDNEMFISKRVGAISNLLAKLLTLQPLKKFERQVEIFFRRLGRLGAYILMLAKRFKVLLFPGMLFEEMGFGYLGPIDGHNIDLLINVFTGVKKIRGPLVVHVVTKKGKGYKPAEDDPTKFHGAMKFEIESGEFVKEKPHILTYTDVFGDTIVKLAEMDEDIIAITAAMREGTGLVKFSERFPERFFDVGIAEQHALAFAAGLAKNGLKPICCIYSTFLQRGLDQLIHDIAILNLPVIIAIDRGGIVGEDGPTHHGCFDLSYLRLIPNFTIAVPKDENELKDLLYSALKYNSPTAIRYPRGKVVGVGLEKEFSYIEKGKAELIRRGSEVYILSVGDVLYALIEIVESIKEFDIGLVNMRFVKPLDAELLNNLKTAKLIITVEENTIVGGFGSAIKEYFSDAGVKVVSIGLPDKFIEHGSQAILREKYSLSRNSLEKKIKEILNKVFIITGI